VRACAPMTGRRPKTLNGRGTSRHTLVFGGSDADPNHDAVMRIGGEAPRRRAHSLRRRASHACLGSPPPRTIMGRPSSTCRREAPNLAWLSAWQRRLTLPDAAPPLAGPRRWSPAAKEPAPAKAGGDEQLARQSLPLRRQGATIMVLRVAPRASAVRARYHCASALSFWNIRKRHASWIMPRRTRALPARASPFSRRFAPLSSGAPVRPPQVRPLAGPRTCVDGPRLARTFSRVWAAGRLRSCVRPVIAAPAAGPDGFRGSRPDQARGVALPHVLGEVSLDPSVDRRCHHACSPSQVL
jgi:hypothetical protein